MSSALIDNDEVFSYPSFGNEAKIKAKKGFGPALKQKAKTQSII